MDCQKVKDFIRDNFMSTGYDLPRDITGHLDECTECRAYLEEMNILGAKLDPIAEISMSPEETIDFETGLNRAIEAADAEQSTYVPENRIFSLTRMALAAAAVLIMMAVSFNSDMTNGLAVLQNMDALQLSQVDTDDMAMMFVNGDSDLLPSLVEDESAAYLTDQIKPGQADDILDAVTAEELEWLMENLTMEI